MTMSNMLLDRLIKDLGTKGLPYIESVDGEIQGFGKELALFVKLSKYPRERELKELHNGILGTVNQFLKEVNENLDSWTCGIMFGDRHVEVVVQGDHFLSL